MKIQLQHLFRSLILLLLKLWKKTLPGLTGHPTVKKKMLSSHSETWPTGEHIYQIRVRTFVKQTANHKHAHTKGEMSSQGLHWLHSNFTQSKESPSSFAFVLYYIIILQGTHTHTHICHWMQSKRHFCYYCLAGEKTVVQERFIQS